MKNHTKTTNKKNSTGFTLIELIVTISVAAILMSIAIPSFKNMINSNRLSTSTNELVSALILARSEALKRSQTVSVCVSSDGATCAGSTDFGDGWIVFMDCDSDGSVDAAVDCDGDGVADDADTVIKAHEGLKDLHISRDGANNHYLGYNFSGRPSGATTFSVNRTGDATVIKEIAVARTGRLRTCDGTCP